MDLPDILPDDVPPHAIRQRLQDLPGGNGGKPALTKHMHTLRSHLKHGETLIIIDSATGSGKTRICPLEVQRTVHGRLLLIARSTLDVPKLCNEFNEDHNIPTNYRMGGGLSGGVHFDDAQIVVITAGLAARWYASNGTLFAETFQAVFFDELGEMEVDPAYAVLFEVAMKIRQRQQTARRRPQDFVVVGAGSALSNKLKQQLTDLRSVWIQCDVRQYPMRQYEITVPLRSCFYITIAQVAASLLKREGTVLVFLPGKHEITVVKQFLESPLLVHKDQICQLHSDATDEEKEQVMSGSDQPQIILATSIAETSITLPNVDYVLDSGFCRKSAEYHDILSMMDILASDAVHEQRRGRAGRVKPGACAVVRCSVPTPTPSTIQPFVRVFGVLCSAFHDRCSTYQRKTPFARYACIGVTSVLARPMRAALRIAPGMCIQRTCFLDRYLEPVSRYIVLTRVQVSETRGWVVWGAH